MKTYKIYSKRGDLIFSGDDLRKTDFRGSDLSEINFRGVSLSDAYLQYADLRGTDLRGASYRGIIIAKMNIFSGLYKYKVVCATDLNSEKWVGLGCYFRKIKDWETDFWNNNIEFPDNGSIESRKRYFAYKVAKDWFRI